MRRCRSADVTRTRLAASSASTTAAPTTAWSTATSVTTTGASSSFAPCCRQYSAISPSERCSAIVPKLTCRTATPTRTAAATRTTRASPTTRGTCTSTSTAPRASTARWWAAARASSSRGRRRARRARRAASLPHAPAAAAGPGLRRDADEQLIVKVAFVAPVSVAAGSWWSAPGRRSSTRRPGPRPHRRRRRGARLRQRRDDGAGAGGGARAQPGGRGLLQLRAPTVHQHHGGRLLLPRQPRRGRRDRRRVHRDAGRPHPRQSARSSTPTTSCSAPTATTSTCCRRRRTRGRRGLSTGIRTKRVCSRGQCSLASGADESFISLTRSPSFVFLSLTRPPCPHTVSGCSSAP